MLEPHQLVVHHQHCSPPPLQPSLFYLYASFAVKHFLIFLSLFVFGFDPNFLL